MASDSEVGAKVRAALARGRQRAIARAKRSSEKALALVAELVARDRASGRQPRGCAKRIAARLPSVPLRTIYRLVGKCHALQCGTFARVPCDRSSDESGEQMKPTRSRALPMELPVMVYGRMANVPPGSIVIMPEDDANAAPAASRRTRRQRARAKVAR